MKINQAFKYELKPNSSQENILNKHAGCARFAYNWALGLIKENKAKPNTIALHKLLNSLKRTQFPWMYEVSKCAPQEALRDLERAFKNFFEKRAKFPRFKKKGRDDSFRLTGSIKVIDSDHIQLPRIGTIRTKEKTDKFNGRILSATVKREADRWYVSFSVEVDRVFPDLRKTGVVGVDCNTDRIVTTETEYELPKPLKKYLHILKRRSKQHSKKQKGSNNRRKSALKLARLYRRIKNIRLDFYHKLSSLLAKTKQVIVVESLNIKGMGRNPYLASSIHDAGWGIFLRMLEYKTQWYGSHLIKAPWNYPSTKRCSRCGYVIEKMPLWKREFQCPNCGLLIDRDKNSALNLALLALPQVLWEVTPVDTGSVDDRVVLTTPKKHPVEEAGSNFGQCSICP